MNTPCSRRDQRAGQVPNCGLSEDVPDNRGKQPDDQRPGHRADQDLDLRAHPPQPGIEIRAAFSSTWEPGKATVDAALKLSPRHRTQKRDERGLSPRVFCNEAVVTRLIGALLLEQNKWAVQRARHEPGNDAADAAAFRRVFDTGGFDA